MHVLKGTLKKAAQAELGRQVQKGLLQKDLKKSVFIKKDYFQGKCGETNVKKVVFLLLLAIFYNPFENSSKF